LSWAALVAGLGREIRLIGVFRAGIGGIDMRINFSHIEVVELSPKR